MKRYNLILDRNLNGEVYVRTYVADDGEWVKYEDIKAETDRIRRSYEHRISGLVDKTTALEGVYPSKWTHFTPKEIPVCNCAEKSDSARKKANAWPEWPVGLKRLRPHWICPAHGYKRL